MKAESTSDTQNQLQQKMLAINDTFTLESVHQHKLTEAAESSNVLSQEEIVKHERMENELRASELRYRRLFEAAQDGILILDADTGRILDVNRFLIKLLGFSRNEMIGKTVGELSPLKDVLSNQAMLERLKKNGYFRYDDLPLETKEGRKISVEFVSNVYQAGDKKVIQCNIRNITERKRVQRESIRLAAIVESSDDAIIGKDLEGIVTNWNKGAEKIFGYTATEMVGTSIMRLIPAERADEENQILDKIRRGESVQHFDTRRQTKDGRLIDVSVTASPIKNESDTAIGVSKVARDITQRKQAEKALRESEERYHSLFNSIDEGFTVIEVLFDKVGTANDYRFLEMNPAFEKQGGFPDALGKRVRELDPEQEAFWFETYGKVALTGEPVRVENEVKSRKQWFDVYAFRLGDSGSRNVAVLFKNITERKHADQELRQAHERLQNVLNSITDGLLVLDKDWRYTYFNEQGASMVGRPRKQLIGSCIWELFPHTKDSKFFEGFHRAVESGQPVYLAEYYPEPLNKWFECRCYPSEEGLSVYFQDITERMRTERALRESEERFRFLNDLVEATRALANPSEIMATMARMLGQHLRASRCAYADVEKNGGQFTILDDYTDGCLSTVGSYQLSAFGARALATLRAGRILIIRDVDNELLAGEGAEIFNAIGIKAIITCPLVKDGELRAMMAVHQTTPRDWRSDEIAIVQDVVERCWSTIERWTAETKIHRLNAELEQRVIERTEQYQAANEELEAFSYSVSHDLRAPLRHVIGFVNLLEQDAGPSLSQKDFRYLATIARAAKRMGILIDDLLAFSRVGRTEMKKIEVNLDKLVRETLMDFQAETDERAIVWEIHPLPVVRADRALLRLVLVNLISNAVKFTSQRATARIEIGCAPVDGGESEIFVRDNGAGFDPQYAHKLFAVFQRLHRSEEFEGTGIGLANIQRIIHRHGGRVRAEGVVNGGATFYFSIPN